MDAQYNKIDYKGAVNFYKHQKRNIYNAGTEYRSSINYNKGHQDQIPLNFIGRKTFHPPTDDSRVFHPAPMDGPWDASKHIPIMTTMPIIPQMH